MEGAHGARRRARDRGDGDEVEAWAPKWRRLAEAPDDVDAFDRTVRGCLNRLSGANASKLLPLDAALRGGDRRDWAGRFAALLLQALLEAVRTSRFARRLAKREGDGGFLPAYVRAVEPLLRASPLVDEAISAWLVRLLGYRQQLWPLCRLVFLAARQTSGLKELPPDCTQRILAFLAPERWDFGRCDALKVEDDPGSHKDAVTVLAHFVLFGPAALWRRLVALVFGLVEHGTEAPDQVYASACLLSACAQRLQVDPCAPELRTLRRLARRFEVVVKRSVLPFSVRCRAEAALSHVARAGRRPPFPQGRPRP